VGDGRVSWRGHVLRCLLPFFDGVLPVLRMVRVGFIIVSGLHLTPGG